jgi:hypothetical protein
MTEALGRSQGQRVTGVSFAMVVSLAPPRMRGHADRVFPSTSRTSS